MIRRLAGTVISDKMTKTVTVEVVHFRLHPKYKKRVKTNKKFLVHNDLGAKVGDRVSIEPTKPISKNKFYKVAKVINN